jgi:hypothetical protein
MQLAWEFISAKNGLRAGGHFHAFPMTIGGTSFLGLGILSFMAASTRDRQQLPEIHTQHGFTCSLLPRLPTSSRKTFKYLSRPKKSLDLAISGIKTWEPVD